MLGPGQAALKCNDQVSCTDFFFANFSEVSLSLFLFFNEPFECRLNF